MTTQENSKVAFVTGGAKGIGKAVVERLAADGMRVAIADMDIGEAKALADTLATETMTMEVNVKDRGAVDGAVAEVVSSWGKLDVSVANAGIMDRAPFLEMTDDFFAHVLETNLMGCFKTGQAAARAMKTGIENGKQTTGRVISTASNSGFFGGRGRTAYGASKAGIINLTQSMAIELAEYNILVNAVAPGPTKTGPHIPDKPWPSVASRMPLARFGHPSEIAAVVSFLASDDSSFVTGHTYCADGGFTISGIMDG